MSRPSFLTPALLDRAQVCVSSERRLIVCSRLLSTFSAHWHTVGANSGSSEEFWGNLCTVSRLIELDASRRQCAHCGCCTMSGFMVAELRVGSCDPRPPPPGLQRPLALYSVLVSDPPRAPSLHIINHGEGRNGGGHHRTRGGVTSRAAGVGGSFTTSDRSSHDHFVN